MASYTVSLRGGFSDRNGIKTENTTMQIKEFDDRTRIAITNATSIMLNEKYHYFQYPHSNECQSFVKQFWSDVYGQAIQWNNYYKPDRLLEAISDTIKTDSYDAVLTVIEYIIDDIDATPYSSFVFQNRRYTATSMYNSVFEQEYVGYRIISGEARPITDEIEVDAIEEALSNEQEEVTQHIDKALGFLSDRESPDYANSIKESISAVERMCSIIVGKSTRLGEALKLLEKKGVSIHPQLAVAFDKLYSYTNGASGIRHAGQLGGQDSTFEEAKFMLVSCCAFVNYLTGVMAKCP